MLAIDRMIYLSPDMVARLYAEDTQAARESEKKTPDRDTELTNCESLPISEFSPYKHMMQTEDILYIAFGTPRPATGYQLSDQILLRIDHKDNTPAGLTIFNFLHHVSFRHGKLRLPK